MAEANQKQGRLEKMAMYEPAVLAARLSKSDPAYVGSALEIQGERLTLDDATRKLLREGVYNNQAGIKKAIEVYSDAYSQARDSLTVDQLTGHYSGGMDLLSDQDKKTLNTELGKFKNETYGNIEKQMQKAGYVSQGAQEGLLDGTPEEIQKKVESARATLEKYQNLIVMLRTLESFKLETLRPETVKRSTKTNLEGLAKHLRGEN